jgi:hypothetical protein
VASLRRSSFYTLDTKKRVTDTEQPLRCDADSKQTARLRDAGDRYPMQRTDRCPYPNTSLWQSGDPEPLPCNSMHSPDARRLSDNKRSKQVNKLYTPTCISEELE